MFYKIYKNKNSLNLFKLIPDKASSYATRNVDGIPLIKIKRNFFKKTFFPSAIIEWSKLDPTNQNAESFGIFKSNILKFIRPAPRRSFNCYNHKGIRIVARLRVGLSHLREHKFNQSFQNCIIVSVVVVWILNQLLTFFSTIPYLMIKESLSLAP